MDLKQILIENKEELDALYNEGRFDLMQNVIERFLHPEAGIIKNNDIETLRSLCKKHPEWLDLPIGVYTVDGSIDFVGAAGEVYSSEYCDSEEEGDYPSGTKILIFSAN